MIKVLVVERYARGTRRSVVIELAQNTAKDGAQVGLSFWFRRDL